MLPSQLIESYLIGLKRLSFSLIRLFWFGLLPVIVCVFNSQFCIGKHRLVRVRIMLMVRSWVSVV